MIASLAPSPVERAGREGHACYSTPERKDQVYPIVEGHVGRTNIVLDDALIKQAMKVSGAKTKREAVDWALREMVARRSVYRALRKLRGKLPWEGDVRTWRRGRR